MSLTLSAAIRIFDRKNEDGGIPDRKRGGARRVSANARNVIVSHVRRAVAHLAQIDHADRLAVEAVDVRPYVGILPEAAYAAAEASGLARPANYRASADAFLDAVLERRDLGLHRSGVVRRDAGGRVHDAWMPLYDALVAEVHGRSAQRQTEGSRLRGGIRGYPSQLIRFQELAARHGVLRPDDLPADYEEIKAWCRESGVAASVRYGFLNAYRLARTLTRATHLPELMQVVSVGDRGLRSLPQLQELVTALGAGSDHRAMSTLDLIDALAPKMGRALRERLKRGRARDLSDAWLREQVDATSRAIASLVRQGYSEGDVRDLTFLDLWERKSEIAAPVSGLAGASDAFVFEDAGLDPSLRVRTQEVPLIRAILDESAPVSALASPVTYHQRAGVDLAALLGVPYTEKIQKDLLTLYGITSDIYEPAISKAQSGRWKEIRREYDQVQEHIGTHNQHFRKRNGINKSLHIYWSHAIIYGVGALRQRAVTALEILDRFRQRHGAVNTQRSRSVELEADTALRGYIVYATLLDDGLRRKNYAGALCNVHFVPSVIRDPSGRWVGFRHVETEWRGFEDTDVRLKQQVDIRRVERTRRRRLSPGIVDLRLLFRYWTETRPRDLVRGGLLGCVAEYNPETDRYAWYIGRRRRGERTYRAHDANARKVQNGGVTPDALGTAFAQLDYWVLTDVLGNHLPAWGSRELHEEYRSIFGPHGSRTRIATYWGGIRGEWSIACWLTDDTEQTLRANYNAVCNDFEVAMRTPGPANPRWFDAVIDRMIRASGGEDWDAFWRVFDPDRPEEALVVLDSQEEARQQKCRPTRKRVRAP